MQTAIERELKARAVNRKKLSHYQKRKLSFLLIYVGNTFVEQQTLPWSTGGEYCTGPQTGWMTNANPSRKRNIQGRVVRNLVNANPGLKVNRRIYFLCIKMFFAAYVLCVWDYLNSKLKDKQFINRKPHHKVTKLKSKFSLILGYFSPALNNPALQEM